MINKLSGWLRAALLFSIVWCLCIVSLVAYERFITIGDTSGPWALYGNYDNLVFHHVEISGQSFSFWLETQKFYTILLLPPVIVWLITAGLIPALKWVRNGFHT
jgi:hypothetical protein